MSDSSAFLDVVTAWLHGSGHPGVTATSVETYATDWDGDTLTGFRGAFDVTVCFVDEGGEHGSIDVEGEALGSLWRAVVGGFAQFS